MQVRGILPILLLLSGCDAPAVEDGLSEGAYVLRGEAMLETPPGGTGLRSEHLSLFVDASGTPTHVRDERYDELFALTFEGDVSDDVCTYTGCDLVVERSTGCAEWTYEEYFRPVPGSDTGYNYTGSVRACPTEEPFVFDLRVSGGVHPGTILPSGRLRLVANYPINPVADAYEVLLDGTPVAASGSEIELGKVPFGAAFEFNYLGTGPVEPGLPTALSTSDTLTDLDLASAPPEGAIDARGEELVYEDLSLVLRDGGYSPHSPFVVAIALGDPGLVSQLALDVDVDSREGAHPGAQLFRADGTGAEMVPLSSDLVPVPPGNGALWLVISCDQDYLDPNYPFDPDIFRIHSLSWQ